MNQPRRTPPRQCNLLSWEDVHRLARQLAGVILENNSRPQLIVAIARGGFVPARLLCDFLQIYDLASIQVEHYGAGAQKRLGARLKYPLPADASDRRVLIVDDVCDSGQTFEVAADHLGTLNPADIKTAALHHKEGAAFRPDFVGAEISEWRWMIYPWARTEDIGAFIERMEGPHPLPVDTITHRLEMAHGIRIDRQSVSEIIRMTGYQTLDGPHSNP